MTPEVEFVSLDWNGGPVSIEYQWIGHTDTTAPLLIFLHEGLGSRAMWKDFPERLCLAAGFRGLVYSRPGYGLSTPRAPDEKWGVDFMHRQAYDLLPRFLEALGIDSRASPPWLLGHSDGGSIALLYAARFKHQLAGAIVLSPHIMVEDISIASIERARRAYQETDLKARLGRYHQDPDSAFWGWNHVWLRDSFRDWSIEAQLSEIRCPILAVQGRDDEYGTLEQIRGIARRVVRCEMIELSECGHSPHRDRGDELIRIVAKFVAAAAGQQGPR